MNILYGQLWLVTCCLSNWRPGCFFFVVAPFCSCPASLVSRIFFAVGPGCAKCFFLLRSVGRRDLSAGPGWCFFFALAPCRRPTGLLLALPFRRAGAKKKNTLGGVFFALAPCRRPTGLLLLLPFAGAAAKKKTPWVVFFFLLWPRAGTGLLLPLPFPGAGAKKKKHPWVVFFFLLRPRADAHSLTAGLGGDASPSPGWCFFLLLRPRPDRGGVFFFCCGPARTLTHSLWAGAISARPGWCFFFFAAAPPGLFRQ